MTTLYFISKPLLERSPERQKLNKKRAVNSPNDERYQAPRLSVATPWYNDVTYTMQFEDQAGSLRKYLLFHSFIECRYFL
jgi:hypothetical protein